MGISSLGASSHYPSSVISQNLLLMIFFLRLYSTRRYSNIVRVVHQVRGESMRGVQQEKRGHLLQRYTKSISH